MLYGTTNTEKLRHDLSVIAVRCIRRGGIIISASSPARTLRSVAAREQLGVMVRGKWLYNTFGAMKQKTLLIDSSEYK